MRSKYFHCFIEVDNKNFNGILMDLVRTPERMGFVRGPEIGEHLESHYQTNCEAIVVFTEDDIYEPKRFVKGTIWQIPLSRVRIHI